eukprot:758909-Hanusia_phi.AAC.2
MFRYASEVEKEEEKEEQTAGEGDRRGGRSETHEAGKAPAGQVGNQENQVGAAAAAKVRAVDYKIQKWGGRGEEVREQESRREEVRGGEEERSGCRGEQEGAGGGDEKVETRRFLSFDGVEEKSFLDERKVAKVVFPVRPEEWKEAQRRAEERWEEERKEEERKEEEKREAAERREAERREQARREQENSSFSHLLSSSPPLLLDFFGLPTSLVASQPQPQPPPQTNAFLPSFYPPDQVNQSSCLLCC